MKSVYERVLLLQPQIELAKYTASLLDEIGFRHVICAASAAQAERLWHHSIETGRSFQLAVCDDMTPGSGLHLQSLIAPLPMIVFSDSHNPDNLKLAARMGIGGIIFRPYGKAQLARAIQKSL